ncbi:hypothetical protein [Streptomyces fildesensis]|uniref:hypothetical protein n=1 Tax=Streptomyces fildesensis TaxID=375757 RepID=UPI001E57D2AB|nr:hypothetical protein [Streptomyces fildesensis]
MTRQGARRRWPGLFHQTLAICGWRQRSYRHPRYGGGSLSLIVAPGLPDTDLVTIGRHLGSPGGPYWHISVGCTPL